MPGPGHSHSCSLLYPPDPCGPATSYGLKYRNCFPETKPGWPWFCVLVQNMWTISEKFGEKRFLMFSQSKFWNKKVNQLYQLLNVSFCHICKNVSEDSSLWHCLRACFIILILNAHERKWLRYLFINSGVHLAQFHVCKSFANTASFVVLQKPPACTLHVNSKRPECKEP